jgi:hypothetical protein
MWQRKQVRATTWSGERESLLLPDALVHDLLLVLQAGLPQGEGKQPEQLGHAKLLGSGLTTCEPGNNWPFAPTACVPEDQLDCKLVDESQEQSEPFKITV